MQTKPGFVSPSKFFGLHQLDDGVYAAIATPGAAAFSNAGIIDLGDRTLIFDTLESPQAAADLRSAAEQLTGRPAFCVINSHSHPDHWIGNQAFDPPTIILAARPARQAMLDDAAYLAELRVNPAELFTQLRRFEERLEKETDPRWRETLERSLVRTRNSLFELPTLVPRLPDLSVDGDLVFYGSQLVAELSVRAGHTDSDLILLLPAQKIAFIGDLGFFASQPLLVYGDPHLWRDQLEGLEDSPFETFVPGHGPLGGKADLVLQRQYMQTMENLIAGVVGLGGTLDEAMRIPLPSPYSEWLTGEMARFERNVEWFYKRLSEA